MSHLFDTYVRMPVALVRGDGAWLYDDQNRRYLDALSGIAVCSLGHAHPRIAAALADQAGKLIHTANIVRIPEQERLAERLAEISGLDRAFIANSGAEAIECALKLARRHAHARGIEQPAVLVASDSFHGRTLAALSASGNSTIQAGFGPLVEGFVRVPFGDREAAAEAFEQHPNLVAALVEPIQGEGGVRVPPDGYLSALRDLCDRHDALLMLDEIQAGIGRTGRWFAFQHETGLLPDVITVAKALGNGVPIGACLAREHVAALLAPGSHGTTFGGNPLACRVALEVLAIMAEVNIPAQAERAGKRLLAGLRRALAGVEGVVDIRGRGLMVGVELSEAAGELKDAAMARGLILNITRGNVIRLLPPLIVDDAQIDLIVEIVADLVREKFAATV
ncbi:aspartate aminotransferase family protein [Wenzhouxiangella limi]|uniref:Acetylornithine aminotransferase n=1 Tax=Wenzhouxiangella limi TaxID=2707351 RepID=A0A845V567_9GAMM|nr:aspartate aminotransferase family protein [Wenzhouxiangella limi]NDY95361.1 aspartate aminotransferase family protein [Wenzhouxiangella limi]